MKLDEKRRPAECDGRIGTDEEAKNWPNIDWQEKIHRGISPGLRHISETP
jgi:hypothetical protein